MSKPDKNHNANSVKNDCGVNRGIKHSVAVQSGEVELVKSPEGYTFALNHSIVKGGKQD